MKALEQWRAFRNSPRYEDRKGAAVKKSKNLLMTILQVILIVGIAYVILSPVIGIISQSFFSDSDSANPMVFTIPMQPTLERYDGAWTELKYPVTLGYTLIYTIVNTLFQVLICSMVGYGFARFDFPLKKLLFACVVVMIVVPSHTIMLPLYMTFRSMELMVSQMPMYILSIFGVGLRSGLYVYIFNQFFRGLPKEIEEAAFVDGGAPGTPTSASCSSTPCLRSSPSRCSPSCGSTMTCSTPSSSRFPTSSCWPAVCRPCSPTSVRI